MIRIGHSHDRHKLVEKRKLILGGKEIEFNKGLEGHSDADVLMHVIAESLLGAMGKGDLGTIFPDTDPNIKDISSIDILKDISGILKSNNYVINNLDAIIFAQLPQINPHVKEMKENISKILVIEENQINIKATTGEKMGYIGRGEGIAAECVCLIQEKK